jgi:hypothetical protein
VVANRLPVSAHKDKDGRWELQVGSHHGSSDARQHMPARAFRGTQVSCGQIDRQINTTSLCIRMEKSSKKRLAPVLNDDRVLLWYH